MGHGHGSVIDGNGQLVGIHVIGPADDEVAAAARQVFMEGPVDAVRKGNDPRRYMDPPRRLLGHLLPLGFAHTVAMAVINGVLAGMGSADSLQAGPAAIAGIQEAGLMKLLQGRIIAVIPFLLDVRAIRTAYIRAFIPVKAQPVQIFHQGPGIDRLRPLFVDIFNPQDQRPAGLAYLQPGQEGRPDIA